MPAVAAFVMNDSKFLYGTTRDISAPGSGIWGAPVTLLDGVTSPFPGATIEDITAGALNGTENYGITANTASFALSVGNGPPDSVVKLSVGTGGEIINFYGTSQGQFTFGGARFNVMRDDATGRLTIKRTTDNGLTWVEQDQTNAPVGVWFNYGSVQRVDSYIYMFLSLDAGATWHIYPFNMATPAYEAAFAPLTLSLRDDLLNTFTNGLYKWPSGGFSILYNNASNLPFIKHWNGSAWGSAVALTGMNYANSVMDSTLNLIHFLNYTVNTGEIEVSPVQYGTVTEGNVVTPISLIPAPVFLGNGDGVGHPAILDGFLFVPRDDTADTHNSVWVALNNSAGVFSKEALPVPVREIGSNPTCTYMVFPNGYSLGIVTLNFNLHGSLGDSLLAINPPITPPIPPSNPTECVNQE